MSKSDDLSENEYQTLNHSASLFREKRSKSETRGRSSTRTYGQGKLSRSSSRDQIRIGDRVIIKGKYIGTCRYVGPIEEEDFSLPEIWFGVQLDEKLTNIRLKCFCRKKQIRLINIFHLSILSSNL